MLTQQADVRDVQGNRRLSGRQSKPSPIKTNDAKGIAQSDDLRSPHLQIERPTVHQKDRRPAALVAVTEAGAVVREVLIDTPFVADSGRRVRASGHHNENFRIAKSFSPSGYVPTTEQSRKRFPTETIFA
jgi:hypothetical protein